DSGQLLISFSDSPPPDNPALDGADAGPFELTTTRTNRTVTNRARPGQARFRFAVFKRYGAKCTFCRITEPKLLEAAHLCPVEENGCDDSRNGLVMCLTHHKAFDVGLLLIDPDSREVRPGYAADLNSIGVVVTNIAHLERPPHPDALAWVWSRRTREQGVERAAQQQ